MLSKPSLFPVDLPVEEETINRRGILVYNICLISISNSVSDGATNKSVLNIERA